MTNVILKPEAEEDLTQAVLWYESKKEGLGAEFLLVVEACLQSISRNAKVNRPVYEKIRRSVLHRFPYIVY